MFGTLESSAGRDIVSTIQSDGSRAREIVSSGSLLENVNRSFDAAAAFGAHPPGLLGVPVRPRAT